MPGIHAIYRYPVKLTPGESIPGDRLYAIENGPSGFNLAAPAYLSKTHFLMLMKNARLASLRTAEEATTYHISVRSAVPYRTPHV